MKVFIEAESSEESDRFGDSHGIIIIENPKNKFCQRINPRIR